MFCFLLLSGFRYYVFNFTPQDFISYDISGHINRMHQDMYVDLLLDRIEKRTDESSPMKICNLDMRQRAKQIIINAFVKKYELLDECFYLDSFESVDINISIIMDKIK